MKLGGWSNSDPAPDYAAIANRGYREFVRETGANMEQFVLSTVAGQTSYDTTTDADPRAWCNFWDDALYNFVVGQPGSGWYLPKSTLSKLRSIDVQYRDIPPAQPILWYYDKGNLKTVALYPTPSETGVLINFNGIRELAPLTEPDDETPFSEIYDEAIVCLGVWWFAKLYTRGAEREVAKEYLHEGMALVERYKLEQSGAEATLINRRVGLPAQEYIQTGTKQVPVYPPGLIWTGPNDPS